MMWFRIGLIVLLGSWFAIPSGFAAKVEKPITGTAPDSVKLFKRPDSLRSIRSAPRVQTRKNSTLIPIDSANLIPKTYTYIYFDSVESDPHVDLAEIQPTNERSNGDLWQRLSGIYPLNLGFFGQAMLPMAPHDPAGLRTEIFGRDNGDPIRGWAPPELISTRGIVTMSGGPFAVGGDKISIEPLIARPRRALMTIDYRDGFYSNGRVDWRFFNPITKSDMWGVGVSVNAADGRYNGTGISTLYLFAHYRHEPLGKPAVVVAARQYVDSVGFAGTDYYRESNRYDVDIMLKKGVPAPDTTQDTALAKSHADSLWKAHWKTDWSVQGYWTRATSTIVTYPSDVGRKLGTIGKYQLRFPKSELTSYARIEELRASIPLGSRVVRPEMEIGSQFDYTTDKWKKSVSVAAIGIRGYTIQPKGTVSVTFQPDSVKSATAWVSRSVRFPTIAERAGVFPQPWFERFFETEFYYHTRAYPYLGNHDLTPVQLWRGGLQFRYHPTERLDVHLYGTSVREANPIQTYLVNINTNFVFQPQNSPSLSYRMGGFRLHSRPFGWGILDAIGTGVKYDGSTPYFIPTVWGYCDVGAMGSWKHNVFNWQSVLRIHYIGDRNWITPLGAYTESAITPVDLLFSLKIYSFRFNWGVGNLLQTEYEAMPGYPAMHREEQWGVSWTLWD